jgi:cysteine desulfurase/selenocysteine lyase
MSVLDLRHHFPYFSVALEQEEQTTNTIYFDSAATSLKLSSVIDVTQKYYQKNTSNVHRSSHKNAALLTEQFEQARQLVQQFVGASSPKEIVWTKGATESLNLIATCLSRTPNVFAAGNEILIAATEHHANILPWQHIGNSLGLTIKVMPIDEKGVLKLDESLQLINSKTALVALAQVSNALGNINPIQDLIAKAKSVDALTVIDGTQAVAHIPVNVQSLDCDFYVFSAHKMFGPTGLGVMYGKQALLDKMPPYQLGGEMVDKVSFTQPASFQSSPLKFEAGTPNIAGVLGLASAVMFVQDNIPQIIAIENELNQVLKRVLQNIPNVILWGDLDNKICVQSFTVRNVDLYDLAVLLDKHNIALRVGHHCAMPLMETLKLVGTLRVSLACYNTVQEIYDFSRALVSSINTLTSVNSDVVQNTVNNNDPANILQNFGVLGNKILTAKSWDETYRQLMLAGKSLDRLPDSEKSPDTEVFGCESQVWVKCSVIDGHLILAGDSASKIIRGLLALMFEALAKKTAAQVLTFSLKDYLASLGLARHLSETRGNGLAAVAEKIKQFCELNKA